MAYLRSLEAVYRELSCGAIPALVEARSTARTSRSRNSNVLRAIYGFEPLWVTGPGNRKSAPSTGPGAASPDRAEPAGGALAARAGQDRRGVAFVRVGHFTVIRDVDLSQIELGRLKNDEPFLLLLVASSLVESGAGVYTGSLLVQFADDPEVAAWLKGRWQPEELQHGRVLRRYVERAWPEFDWQRTFDRFIADYSTVCRPEALEPSHGLEMAARCVVETGTAALYRAIHRYVEEPALRRIVGDIASEEIGHYKHFYRYFRKYQRRERNGRISVLAALVRRSLEFRSEDANFGLRHAYDERCRSRGSPEFGLDELTRRVSGLIKENLPLGMAAKMWIKPLRLPGAAARMALRVAPALVQRLIF